MNSKSTVTLKKLVMAALFAALACVATMSIKIPTPGTSGYIHPGDAIVILAGVVLGPAWGFLAGGIGSALVSLCSALLYRKVGKNSKSRYTAVILGGVADIILVAGGYCLCEYFIYGAGAFASVPANLVQGIGGLILSAVLYPILIAIPDVKQTALANS